MRISVSPVLLCVFGALSACTATQRQRTAEIALFPVNVVPDILSNTLVILTLPAWAPFSGKDYNLLGVIWLMTPIMGPWIGVADAWHGYPFWDPGFFDQDRSDEPSAEPEPADRAGTADR